MKVIVDEPVGHGARGWRVRQFRHLIKISLETLKCYTNYWRFGINGWARQRNHFSKCTSLNDVLQIIERSSFLGGIFPRIGSKIRVIRQCRLWLGLVLSGSNYSDLKNLQELSKYVQILRGPKYVKVSVVHSYREFIYSCSFIIFIENKFIEVIWYITVKTKRCDQSCVRCNEMFMYSLQTFDYLDFNKCEYFTNL